MSLWKIPPPPKTGLGLYRILSPHAGVRVSPMVLGAMSIGDKWGEVGMGQMDKESSFKLLDAYFDSGGNFIDTANNYQDESSEQFVGEWAEKRGIRDQLFIATKYTTNFKMRDDSIEQKILYVGNNAKSMRISVDASLKKLRTDYIDLLYVHWWDWNTSVEEVMNHLHMLVSQGKVLYLGVSDTPAWIVSKANQYARDHGLTPFVIYQGAWNVMERSFEREIIPMAKSEGLALAPWNVLAGGKIRTDEEEERRRQTGEKGRTGRSAEWERNAQQKEVCQALEKVAKELGAQHITAVAIAYLMQKTPYVFPIVGGRKVEHLLANTEALELSLSDEQIKYLESVVPFDPGFPNTMIGDGTEPSIFIKSSGHAGKASYNRFYGTGNATSSACGRLSYLLDVHGPSITVETACSGSFVALDQAVRHLQSGRGESAIVCGVNTHTLPGMFGFVSAQKMTSTNSRCATFTNDADGYAASEGVISLIVKTESAALRDGDKILGLIKATDTMHNGRTQGLIAPSAQAQARLQRSLLRLSNLEPAEIDLLESHGTGTSLGDLIEIEGINDVFRSSHDSSRPLLVGAGKSTIGHTETVSGLLGLVSTLLAFEKSAVPGVNHLNEANLNPSIDCTIIPMHIPCDTVKLKRRSNMEPYRGMVLSYGFAGTISGVVVESPPMTQPGFNQTSIDASYPMLFVVSAKSQMGLVAYIHSYISFCLKAPAESFQSICYTSCACREHYAHRFATVATNMEDLIAKLRERQAQGLKPSASPNPRIVFGFPGQGSQFSGMAKALADRFSGFRDIIVEYASEGESLSGFPLLGLMLGTDEGDVDIDNSQVAQICIFVYQCALAKWLTGLGVKADAVFGHSLGEFAAAVVSGAFEFSDALALVIARAGFLRPSESSPGAMLAMVASADTIATAIQSLGVQSCVEIAVYNGTNSHVVSGAKDAIDALYTKMKAEGIRCSILKVDQGFHSPSIERGLPALQSWFEDHETIFRPLQLPYYSTYLGERIASNQYLRLGYWLKHARNPVRLSAAASCIRNESSLSIFLDMGPQPMLMTAMQNDDRTGRPLLIPTTCKAGKDQEHAFLGCLARLFENRVSLDLDQLYLQYREPLSKASIPTYPYQRQHHYPEIVLSRNTLKGLQYEAEPPSEFLAVDQPLIDLLNDHRVMGRKVLPGAAFADLLARFSSNKTRSVGVVRFHQPLVLEKVGKLVQISQQSNGSFRVFQNGSTEDADKLCSGTFASGPVAYTRRSVKTDETPAQILTHEEIYRAFEGKLHFGRSFKNVEKIYMFSDHIDAYIRVPPSHNQGLDRIRQLDPCLHLLGALVPLLKKKAEGIYLPAALEGFSLHTDDLPSSFICRYFLPADMDSSGNTLSLSLEVFSPSGELLVSCRRYLVAWLPKGVAIQAPPAVLEPHRWLRSTWKHESLTLQNPSVPPTGSSDMVIYLSDSFNSDLLAPFAVQAEEVLFLDIGREQLQAQSIRSKAPPTTVPFDSLPKILYRKQVSVVLEASRVLDPHSDEFTRFWKHVLAFMKLTLSGVLTSKFVVVSRNATPMDPTISQTSSPSVGSVVQGLIRVYRRELGLQRRAVWGLDLPENLTAKEIAEVVASELADRQKRKDSCHSVVSYRRAMCRNDDSLVRLVPVLLPASHEEATADDSPNGVTVVVGMGAIGTAIGASLVRSGAKTVVFIGRRPAGDGTIIEALKTVQGESNMTTVLQAEYIQTDATDLPALRDAFNDVKTRFFTIDDIIYTAGVVRDARINVLKEEDFAHVLRSKVTGAWNVHLVCQAMKLSPRSFALLSSISVPLGNPGQAAYVAANSFLDALAAYRQSLGLNGTSLQLGAWKSHLTDNLDLSGSGLATMSNDIGIPLVLRAMRARDPVQVIAELDIPALQQNPVTASDPLFLEVYVNGAPVEADVLNGGPLSKSVVRLKVINIVKGHLMLKPEDELELGQSLSSFGIDSIAFAQIRGEVLNALSLELPMIYLSDFYSVEDMLNALCKDLSE